MDPVFSNRCTLSSSDQRRREVDPKCRMNCPHGKPVDKNATDYSSRIKDTEIPDWCRDTMFNNCCYQFLDCLTRCGMEKNQCEDRFSRCGDMVCDRRS